jgi:hypothetical protein
VSRAAITAGAGAAFVAGVAWTSPETREAIAWAWTFALTVLADGPLGLWAVLVGVALGWLSMAWARALLPAPRTIDPKLPQRLERRRMAIWLVGLVVTIAVTFAIWRTAWGVWLGVTLGLAAPWTWEGVLLLVGAVSPAFAEKLRGAPL